VVVRSALAVVRGAYSIIDGKEFVVVGACAAVLGALALDGETSGDFVSPAQTNSPFIGAPRPRPPDGGSANGATHAATAATPFPR
jgi:hypothetical protein